MPLREEERCRPSLARGSAGRARRDAKVALATLELAWEVLRMIGPFAAAAELAADVMPLDPAAGAVLGRALHALGDLDGALAHLDTSIARGLDHFTVRLDRAAVLRDLGRHAEARRELLRAQTSAPAEPAVIQALQAWAQPQR